MATTSPCRESKAPTAEEAAVDARFYEKLKVRDQIPILVRDDVCYVPEDVRWGRDFLSYYWYYLLSGLAGFALIGYAVWKARAGKTGR